MALARMIIVDELPFRFVEHGGFIDFMAEIEPRFKVPSRVTIARDCLRVYIREKESLRKVLMACQRVCLTTDTWTSIQNLNYLCLTAHYIDVDWVYHKKILNFCLVHDHKGETISRVRSLVGWLSLVFFNGGLIIFLQLLLIMQVQMMWP